MSTLPQILPATTTDPVTETPGMAGSSAKPEGMPGMFEHVMANALSPTLHKTVTIGGQSQPSQASPAIEEDLENLKKAVGENWPNQASQVPQNPGSSSKSTAKSSSADSNPGTPPPVQPEAHAILNPRILMDQMVTAAVPIVNPPVQLSPQTATVASATVSKGTSGKSAVVPTVFSRANQTSTQASAAGKVSTADLSENQAAQKEPRETSPAISLPLHENLATMKGLQASTVEDSATENLGNAKCADEADTQSVTEAASNGSAVQSQPPDAHGTSIAKQDMAMNQAEKMNKIAGQTEKVLPGGAVSVTRADSPSVPSPHEEQATAAVAANAQTTGNAGAVSAASTEPVAVSAPVDARSRILERTQDMVTLNATRLSDSGNNSMQVVIKPDAGTQLSLELRQQGGKVEVQAVLQQGDFNHLSQQWPDLQQRLNQKGIELAPLGGDATSGNSPGNEAFQNKQNPASEIVPGLALTEAPSGTFAGEKTYTPAHSGWETWA